MSNAHLRIGNGLHQTALESGLRTRGSKHTVDHSLMTGRWEADPHLDEAAETAVEAVLGRTVIHAPEGRSRSDSAAGGCDGHGRMAGSSSREGFGSRLRATTEAFRGIYGPQDRPESTISGLRGVWGEIGARQRAPPSPEAWSATRRSLPFVWLAAKRPGGLPATARPRLFRAVPERRFGGVRWGCLTTVNGRRASLPLVIHKGWRGAPPLRSPQATRPPREYVSVRTLPVGTMTAPAKRAVRHAAVLWAVPDRPGSRTPFASVADSPFQRTPALPAEAIGCSSYTSTRSTSRSSVDTTVSLPSAIC